MMPERDWNKDWELAMRATPGPWYAIPHPEYEHGNWRVDTKPNAPWANFGQLAYMRAENAQFVAEARSALPYWLQRVRDLERAIINFVEARELAERTGVWVVMTPVMWDAFEELRRKVMKTK